MPRKLNPALKIGIPTGNSAEKRPLVPLKESINGYGALGVRDTHKDTDPLVGQTDAEGASEVGEEDAASDTDSEAVVAQPSCCARYKCLIIILSLLAVTGAIIAIIVNQLLFHEDEDSAWLKISNPTPPGTLLLNNQTQRPWDNTSSTDAGHNLINVAYFDITLTMRAPQAAGMPTCYLCLNDDDCSIATNGTATKYNWFYSSSPTVLTDIISTLSLSSIKCIGDSPISLKIIQFLTEIVVYLCDVGTDDSCDVSTTAHWLNTFAWKGPVKDESMFSALFYPAMHSLRGAASAIGQSLRLS